MRRAVVRFCAMPRGRRHRECCARGAFGWRRARLLASGVSVLCLLASAAPALADRPFTARFSTNDTGNIAFAANTLMTCPTAAAGCTSAQQTGGIVSGTNNALDNNNYTMGFVNTAPGTVAGSPSFNSSSATLSLPSTATVLFAGLYWGGDVSAGVNGVAAHNSTLAGQVGFRPPGASGYTTLNAAPADLNFSTLVGDTNRYGGFVNVTSLVQAAGAGTYSVSNVQAGTGQDRYAGWTLVVAYHDSTQPPRNLTVFDGFASINSGNPPVNIPVSGFKTPPAGAVRTEVGFVAYEGDAGLTGDSASLDGTTLSDAANPPTNFFNSAISTLGANVTTKSPNFVNQLGFDAKLVTANGVIPNSATAATVQITTSGDTYFDQVISFATDLYAPNITSSKSVTNITHPGGPDRRGDLLQYTVSYTNTGADPATNFVMHDPIPAGSTYVPGSLRIIAGPQAPASPTDALGDDAGEFNSAAGQVVFRLGTGANATTGGAIAPNGTDTVTFEVRINASDVGGQQIVNQATATFVGQTLGASFTDTSPQVTNTVAVPDLTIVKSHTGSLVGGVPTTFTLAVSNVGTVPTDGSTVTVSDPFPSSSFSSIANAGGSGWNCGIAALTLTCTRSDALAAGTSYPPILVDATVQDPPPATVSNTATVSGGGSASSSGSDGGGASGLADVSITKSAQPGTVASGGQVTYTLNVRNAGPSAAQNVVVSDPLVTGAFTAVSAQTSQPGGSCNTTVSCSLGTLTAYSTATITITATVIAHDTTLTNTASVSSSTPDPDTANNSASASVTVPPSADLTIAKTGTVNPAPGPDSFTVTVSNNGPDSASGVVVNDSLPSQFTATGASGGGFTCTLPGGPGGTLVCTQTSLTVAAGPQQIVVTGTLATGTEGEMPVNVATVSSDTADPDLTNNTATFTQLVVPSADVGITKLALVSGTTTPLTTPVVPGGTFDYQLTVTNSGPSPAANVVVMDTLPTDITLTATAPGCAPGAGSGGTITCTIGTLASGATQIITLHVIVSTSAPGAGPTNTATVSSTTADPNPSNNSSSATVGISPVADLALSKSVSPQTANVGDVVTYSFVVTNNGPEGTGGLVSDDLPAGLQFVSSSSCTDNPGPPETVSCNVGALAPNASATASFTARVTSAAAGTQVQNQANVASIAAGPFPELDDPSPDNNTSSASLAVSPQADVSLTKTVSNPNPGTDDEVVYTLTASNAGPDDATGVTITDSLPAGLDFLDASPGCNNNSGTVTCDLGTIANGGNASVTIAALTTAAVAGASVTNVATVSANELDPSPGNNQATVSIDVKPLVDLELTKVASNPTANAGGPVSYTLILVNNGPSPATGVTISDPLANPLTFVAASPSQGSCSASGQTVTCQLGTVAMGGAAVVTITADVAASAAGASVQNTATATANEPIARPQLASAQASITPDAQLRHRVEADLAIVKTVNHANARTGQALTYTITVTNHGPDTSHEPTVTDVFSAPVTVLSVHTSSGSCKRTRTITCRLASMSRGARDRIRIVAKPTSIGELRNAASVASRTTDPRRANNAAHVTTKVRPGPARLRLTKTASRRSVTPGEPFSFTIALHSLGPEPALGVQVCDRLGSGMAFISVDHASFRQGSACWKVKSLAKGKARRYVVEVRALGMVTGGNRLTNVATASAVGVRTRTARASVTVASPPPVPAAVTG